MKNALSDFFFHSYFSEAEGAEGGDFFFLKRSQCSHFYA